MKYLLLGAAAGLACGVALAQWLASGWWLLPAGIGLIALALWRKSPLLFWSAALVLGLMIGQPGIPTEDVRRLPSLTEIGGKVVSMPELHPSTVSFQLSPPGFAGKILVYLPPELIPQTELVPGATVHILGEGDTPEPPGWREYLQRRGIGGIFWGRKAEIVAASHSAFFKHLVSLRRRLLEKLVESLPQEGAALLAALLLGERGLLPTESKAAFRSAGVAHLLALSGLHLGILAAIGWWILGLARLKAGWRYLVLLPFVWGYVLLAGSRLSLIRAAIMLSLLGVFAILWDRGWVLRRWYEPLESLGAAALVILVIWPQSALELGFQLSFSATFAILYLWPHWRASRLRVLLPRPLRYGADVLATSAFAQLGTLPLSGSGFGYIPPYGLVANLILIPWTGGLLGAGIFLLALPPAAAQAVGPWVYKLAISPYLTTVKLLSGLPGARLAVGSGFGLWYLLALLGILILMPGTAAFRAGSSSQTGGVYGLS